MNEAQSKQIENIKKSFKNDHLKVEILNDDINPRLFLSVKIDTSVEYGTPNEKTFYIEIGKRGKIYVRDVYRFLLDNNDIKHKRVLTEILGYDLNRNITFHAFKA